MPARAAAAPGRHRLSLLVQDRWTQSDGSFFGVPSGYCKARWPSSGASVSADDKPAGDEDEASRDPCRPLPSGRFIIAAVVRRALDLAGDGTAVSPSPP
jgi:hypothetical protein